MPSFVCLITACWIKDRGVLFFGSFWRNLREGTPLEVVRKANEFEKVVKGVSDEEMRVRTRIERWCFGLVTKSELRLQLRLQCCAGVDSALMTRPYPVQANRFELPRSRKVGLFERDLFFRLPEVEMRRWVRVNCEEEKNEGVMMVMEMVMI